MAPRVVGASLGVSFFPFSETDPPQRVDCARCDQPAKMSKGGQSNAIPLTTMGDESAYHDPFEASRKGKRARGGKFQIP